jgi:hypothetical protein
MGTKTIIGFVLSIILLLGSSFAFGLVYGGQKPVSSGSINYSSELIPSYRRSYPIVIGTDSDLGYMVKINPDGSILFGANYKPDAASKIFWESISQNYRNMEEENKALKLKLSKIELLLKGK